MPDSFDREEPTAASQGKQPEHSVPDAQLEQAAAREKLSLQELFDLIDQADFPPNFMADRETHMPVERDFSWMEEQDSES